MLYLHPKRRSYLLRHHAKKFPGDNALDQLWNCIYDGDAKQLDAVLAYETHCDQEDDSWE